VINLIGFNICWFGLIYLGNSFIPIATIFLLTHLFILSDIRREQVFLVAVASIGIFIDATFSYLGLFIFTENIIPAWLVFLWICFATTICHSLAFLEKNYWWQVIAGILAPLNYIAGEGVNVVSFGQSNVVTYLFLAPTWVILFIVFYRLKKNITTKVKVYV